jgi:hypothetical protein
MANIASTLIPYQVVMILSVRVSPILWNLILPVLQAALSSEVQFGQRVALIGMLVKQYGQFLVAGTAGAASCLRIVRLKSRINKNITNATIRKLIIAGLYTS